MKYFLYLCSLKHPIPITMNSQQHQRYVNPYTDFGFKKLFGTEMNKELLISFLNALFNDEVTITDLSFLPMEQLNTYGGRRAVFDVFCETENGEKIIVEMQKTEQAYFKDRSVFYSSFPIQDQAMVGDDWNYQLKHVYTVGILNFVFDEDKDDQEYLHHEVKLRDSRKKKVFYDKLTFIYLEMPKFNKREDELETMFDKWLFVLKNLTRLLDRPEALQERVFKKLFQQAEIARLTQKERLEYAESVKVYRDLKNSMDTSFVKGEVSGFEKGEKSGFEKGEKKKNYEIAQRMKQKGYTVSEIAELTDLIPKEIEKLS